MHPATHETGGLNVCSSGWVAGCGPGRPSRDGLWSETVRVVGPQPPCHSNDLHAEADLTCRTQREGPCVGRARPQVCWGQSFPCGRCGGIAAPGVAAGVRDTGGRQAANMGAGRTHRRDACKRAFAEYARAVGDGSQTGSRTAEGRQCPWGDGWASGRLQAQKGQR